MSFSVKMLQPICLTLCILFKYYIHIRTLILYSGWWCCDVWIFVLTESFPKAHRWVLSVPQLLGTGLKAAGPCWQIWNPPVYSQPAHHKVEQLSVHGPGVCEDLVTSGGNKGTSTLRIHGLCRHYSHPGLHRAEMPVSNLTCSSKWSVFSVQVPLHSQRPTWSCATRSSNLHLSTVCGLYQWQTDHAGFWNSVHVKAWDGYHGGPRISCYWLSVM